ncbi:3-hydroxyacyl-CoA dehydrogenase NAD-binding domain-containing protein [Emticicia sp. 21SJ11W-3]|uniref:3-hydroxyacyl-CoA dehydrogenase NAD-binding domain-containing protein n=1 Tax=Emticicia sp. 21SJ11W-3 TaxID=2916755 RepID=UPI0020A04C24|nr:3-hydroxyacyl-CoA dehydrogenase NAD-binding domain-containing protein [Emticicia sp. 21SJ11W-3]UTA69325.1 3-hydroxyacyl-CoA dehydrogenase NAD-binding domain-containing protein [Emticicia sp. 21SJ11W-3]
MEINYRIENNVAILSWNMTTSPMNVLNDVSIPEFESHLKNAYADSEVKGIIITSEKNEFIAGADVKMLLKNNDKDPSETYKFSLDFNKIFRTLETCGKPVVAAINGTALGGGFEVCLSCHYRIALDNPKAQIGLPEVQLGLLPGGGGTQRLPRLIGMEPALLLMVEGKRISPKEAFGYGMVNDLAATREELMEKAMKWILANPKAIQPWDEFDKKTGAIKARENYKVPGGNVQSPTGMRTFAGGTAMIMDKTKGNYPAPIEILSCVYEGLQVNIDRAIAIEVRHFVKVATSREAKNLIGVMFLGKNEADKGASRPKDVPKTEVKKLGILGAGFMGSGIAYVSAMAGIEVVLKDVSIEGAEKGKDYSRSLVQKGIEKGKTTKEKGDLLLSLIQPTDKAADLKGCDLIIEAVFENRELKATVTQEAEPMLAEGGVFGSNTSTIPISGLAKASAKPENFIGIHFFSPVDKMMLVELIRGKQTSDYAVALAVDYVKKIRKTPIVVNDSRGFYTSRCFSTYTSEGIYLLKDGVDPVLIENAGKYAGMPVGALAVSDEVALDLALKITRQSIADGALTESDDTYQAIRLMVEDLGRLGKKNKKGFYEYPADGKKYLWDGLAEYFPVSDSQPEMDEVKKRLLYRQVVESIRCFDEGVLTTKLDGNIGSILAWGFPPYAGGTLNFPEFVGKETFLNECNRLANTYGERFRLTQKQEELVRNL